MTEPEYRINYGLGESFANCHQCGIWGKIQPNPDQATINRSHHPDSPHRCLGCEWANSSQDWPHAKSFSQFVTRRYGRTD